jgi:spore germination protein (amino acid permease)
MNSERINPLEVIMILLLSIGLVNHVIIIPMLLDRGGRDSWISVITSGLLLILFSILVFYLMKWSNQENLFVFLKKNYSPLVAWIVTLPLCIYLFVSGFVTYEDTVSWAITSYLPQFSSFSLGLLLMVLCFYAAFLGIRVIAIASGIVLPLVVMLGFFVMTANIPNKEYALLKPILEFGVDPVLQGMVVAGGGFIEIILLLLMQHRIKKSIKLYHVLILGIFLIGLTIGPLTGAISEFGPQLAREFRYPAFEEWRLVTLGTYVEHLDYFSIFQWLSGAFIRISLAIFLIPDLLNITDSKKRGITLLVISLLYITSYFFPISDISFYIFINKYLLPSQLTILITITLLILILVIFKKKEGR